MRRALARLKPFKAPGPDGIPNIILSKCADIIESRLWYIFTAIFEKGCVTVSPSPQSKDEENEKLHELRRYARDFRRQHTTDAEQFDWDSDDGDYGLAIGRLVVT
jgi:hypothetical protein